jgi:hypothetical protein
MARQRRKLTRREKIFGQIGAVIFVAISVVSIRASGAFTGLGIMAIVFSGWLGALVAIWGFVIGSGLARITDKTRLPPVTGWPLTARKVPKSK